MELIFQHRPNMSAAGLTTPAGTAWTALTYPTGWPSSLVPGGTGAQLVLETVNAGGTAAGDAYEFLTGQGSAPTTQKGLLVPANVLWLFDSVPSGIYIKLVTGSDVLRAFVLY